METSSFQQAKLELVAFLGLPKDTLHVYAGLAIFLVASLVTRKGLGSPVAWLLVLAAALAGEAWDGYDDWRSIGYWRWRASWHDVWNTLFWPTVLFGLGRAKLLGRTGSR